MNVRAYYNEFEPYAADWLRNLIAAGLIAPGEVDQRSIVDVQPDDLRGFTQCHFFAGLGGWSFALRRAGWSDDRSVWTGSCPCQPFSTAGKRTKQSDERHLWPHWFRLIRECRPAKIFGEQVASAVAAGWLDDVFHDLETENYACASAVLPACAAGAFHRRDRLWFVADAKSVRRFARRSEPKRQQGQTGTASASTSRSSMDNTIGNGRAALGENHGTHDGVVAIAASEHERNVADTDSERSQRIGPDCDPQGRKNQDVGSLGLCDGAGNVEWLPCPDGKARPVKSGLCLLAHGVPNRVGRLRAFGNAIDPRPATEFIKAFIECQ